MNHIVRKIITFPGVSDDGHVSSVGIPGAERFGSGLVARSANDAIGSLTFPPSQTTPAMARHNITIPATHDGQPFVGIGLAPDSLFEAFKVHLNTIGADLETEHLVSVGNPLPMDAIGEAVGITIPVSIASLQAILQPSSIAVGAIASIDVPSGGQVWAWPLPIELYYGSIPHRTKRPTYHDRVIIVQDNDGQQSSAFFLVDGRRDVEIQIVCPTGDAGTRIARLDGRIQGPRFDNMEGTLIVGEDSEDALSVPMKQGINRYPLYGRSPTMVKVEIDGTRTEGGTTAGAYQVSIIAD